MPLYEAGELVKNLRGSKTQREFAKEIGISQASLNFIENNKRGIPDKVVKRIDEVYNTDIKKNLIYNLYLKEQKIGNQDFCIIYKKPETKISNIVPVPLHNTKAAAGQGEILPEYTEKEVLYFDRRWLENIINIKPQNAALIQAVGDSMDSGNNNIDDIKDGDLLLIDESIKDFINNKIYVIRLDNSDLVVKKVNKDLQGNVTLISNNPKYSPRELTEENEAVIIGRVLWNGSKESL